MLTQHAHDFIIRLLQENEALSGNVLIGNADCHAETISACWTPFRHCGLHLWGVVCPLSALSVPDEKKDDSSLSPPHTANGNLGNKSPKVTMTCQFGITLSAKYISMRPGIKQPSFGPVILHRYADSLHAPRLFSRPDDPRSSALIGLWNVERALPAPLHSCSHCNLYAFRFPLRY